MSRRLRLRWPGARSDSASGRSSEPPKVLLRQLHSDEHLSNGDAPGGPPSLGGRRGPRARRRRRAPRPAQRFPPAAAPPVYGERYQGGKWRLRSPRSPGVITFTHTPARTHTRSPSRTGARRARLILARAKYNIYVHTHKYAYVRIYYIDLPVSPSSAISFYPPSLQKDGWEGYKMLPGLGSREAARRGGLGRFC